VGHKHEVIFVQDGPWKVYRKNEHRTSNVQHRMLNEQKGDPEMVKTHSDIKKQKSPLNVRYLIFVFNSTLDVGCSMFDVHLSKQFRTE